MTFARPLRRVAPSAPAVLLALLLASCAHVPAPLPVPTPVPAPAPVPGPPAHRPSPVPAPATVPYSLDAEPTYDIALAMDVDTLMLAPVERTTLTWRSPDGGERSAEVRDAVRLRVSGAQVVVEPLGRERAVPLAYLESADTLWVGERSLERGAAGALSWNGRHWRGRFKVFLNPRRHLTLVTRVALEAYLLGVVPGEIGALSDSLIEAGRAQAVAARSYSLFYRGRRGAEGFDMFGSVEDQLYGPVENERPLATRCVVSTHGLVSMYAGAPIRANYCSTCGGISAEVWEAWPAEPLGYLRSVADDGAGTADGGACALSPQFRWRESWTAEQFVSILARCAPAEGVALPPGGVGDLRDVVVDARSTSGRVWRLRVLTSTGEIVVPAYALRRVLRRPGPANAILRSTLFKIGVRRGAGNRAVAVIASGAGSGHGVGLCQTGALGMARAGAKATAILAHYYAGSETKKLY